MAFKREPSDDRNRVSQLRVSVLTPSYNQARWIGDNLRSVAKQSYPFIEHIVSDGGSTDETRELLVKAGPRVAWESKPDLGQSDAINRAFARSTGDIVGWLNSDDAYFASDVVANAVRVFDSHPEVGVVYGHAALVNGSGTVLHVLWTPDPILARPRWYNFICQPTVFVRRSALGRDEFVDPKFDYMMDHELWLHLSQRTRFHRINRIVAIDRHHANRKSYTRLDLAVHDRDLIVRQYNLPRGSPNAVMVKGIKVGIRVAGLSKLRELRRGSDILALDIPPALTLGRRQVAQLREWMPDGGD